MVINGLLFLVDQQVVVVFVAGLDEVQSRDLVFCHSTFRVTEMVFGS